MRVIDAAGSPRDLGRAVGAAAADLIARAVDLVCRFDVDGREVDRRLERASERLAAAFPDALEEMDGVAEGARLGARDVRCLTLCSEIGGRLPAYCSLAALAGADGALVAKNLDTRAEMGAVQAVERLAPADGLAYVHVTTAGALWTDGGVNEAGLALANASLAPAAADDGGVPDGVLARELLGRCPDVPAAVDLAGRHGVRTLGENLLLADAAGRTAVVEKLPGGQAVRDGGGGALTACNHPLTPRLQSLMDRADPVAANSRRRHARLRAALGDGCGWTPERLAATLADAGAGIRQRGEDDLWTVATLVVAPALRTLWLSTLDGAPLQRVALDPDSDDRQGKEHAVHVQSR